jgi:deazaflavin-dependent oxidoreductase (nitroreductase family)
MPNIRWLLALITAVHRFLYVSSGGRIGHRAPGYQFLLLGCRGRKSGREYVTPLLYVPDGDRYVVVGSNAGDPRDPGWWKNLRANPDAWVQVGRVHRTVRAREASPAEFAAIWPRVVSVYRSFERYKAHAGRPIPLVLLEPVVRDRARERQ